MGENLINFYKTKIKREWKIAFLATFLIGLLVHIYKFTNSLPNNDATENYYHTQNIISSGRWFLSIACGISSYFDLPWVIGIISLVFIGLTVVVITDLFELKNPVLIAIAGGLFATFPGMTETFYFEYTADGYMLAMLLGALAVGLSKVGTKKKSHILAATCCITLSCGIYQTYVSFALVLAVCYFMTELLENRYSAKEYLRWIFSQAFIYGGGMIAYYVIWKVLMCIQGVSASGYQGISTASVSLSKLLNGIPDTFETLQRVLFRWDRFNSEIGLYGILNIIFLMFAVVGFVLAAKKKQLFHRKLHLTLYILCIACIPFVSCMYHFISKEVIYRPMMLQSLCVLLVFVPILYERYSPIRLSNIVGVLMALMIFNNGLLANISYFYMNREYQYSYATVVELASRIHLMDTDSTEVAFIGNFDNEAYSNPVPKENRCVYWVHLWRQETFWNETLLSDYKEVDLDKLNELQASDEVAQMGVWPASDSVKVIDDVIVIKLSELAETE